jgi:hypothetical protein
MSYGTNSSANISFGYDSQKIFDYREKNMCENWKENVINSNLNEIEMKTYENDEGMVIVKGSFRNIGSFINSQFIKFVAPNPPTFNQSFSGSGLPYPNKETAFDETPNKGVVPIQGGQFKFKLHYPNSYYDNLGKVYVPPCFYYNLTDGNGNDSKIEIVKLGDGIPYRTLTWPQQRNWYSGPEFYTNKDMPVRSQEQILRDSAYPVKNMEYKNFWGTRPPY